MKWTAAGEGNVNVRLSTGIAMQPEVRERLKSNGLEAVGGTTAALGDYLKSEIARWAKVVKEAGIKPE